MLLFRLLLALAGVSVALCVAAYLIGGDRRWLGRAWLTAKIAAAAALVFFAVLLLERLAA